MSECEETCCCPECLDVVTIKRSRLEELEAAEVELKKLKCFGAQMLTSLEEDSPCFPIIPESLWADATFYMRSSALKRIQNLTAKIEDLEYELEASKV